MPPSAKILLCYATLALLAATGLGAYASHGLGDIDPAARTALQTAIEFQFFHGLGLLAVGVLIDRYPGGRALPLAGMLLAAGIVLFSGSIYATRLVGLGVFGRLAPTGGICLMAGWLVLAWGILRLPAAGSRS